MIVKQIEAKDTYPLRSHILRANLPVQSCHFEGDHDDHTFHLGAFVDDELASIASFYFICNPYIKNNYQYQLRGMATVEKFQKQGLSSALLRTAFPIIKNNNVDLLWCNARVESSGFYEKVGFKIISEIFTIDGVGDHYLMTKEI